MKLFGKNPQAWAMQTFLHDTSSSLLHMSMMIRDLEAMELTPEAKSKLIGLRASRESLKKLIDKYYEKWQEFPEPQNEENENNRATQG